MDDILVLSPNLGYGQYTGTRVLVVVGEDARVLVMGKVDGLSHGLLVARDGGREKILGILYRFYQRLP